MFHNSCNKVENDCNFEHFVGKMNLVLSGPIFVFNTKIALLYKYLKLLKQRRV